MNRRELNRLRAEILDRLGDHSKNELQEIARQRGLSTGGTKDEIIYRLVNERGQSASSNDDE